MGTPIGGKQKKKENTSKLSWLIQLQTMIQAPMKPAQWIPFIRDMHRYEMNIRTFTLSDTVRDNFEDLIALAVEKSGLAPQYPMQKVNENMYILTAYYHTPKNAWLDVVSLTMTHKNDIAINIDGVGESTGVFPLTIPFAPL